MRSCAANRHTQGENLGRRLEDHAVRARHDDPDLIPQEQYVDLPEEEQSHYYDRVAGNKIGGTPAFFQGDDWPDDGPWRLLLQLEDWPFHLNLGAGPVVFAFVSPDGRQGRFLVQDS